MDREDLMDRMLPMKQEIAMRGRKSGSDDADCPLQNIS
jgi:hypothetical protein